MNEQLSEQLSDLKGCKQRYEKCFERIAISYGITSPWILVCMAKDNDENYAEILTRFIEEQQSKSKSVTAPATKEGAR